MTILDDVDDKNESNDDGEHENVVVRQDRRSYAVYAEGKSIWPLQRFVISRSIRVMGKRNQKTYYAASPCSTLAGCTKSKNYGAARFELTR